MVADGVAVVAIGAVPAIEPSMQNNHGDSPSKALAESENFLVWEVQAPDGEITYHVELGAVTLHFFREEWHEFLQLIKVAASNT